MVYYPIYISQRVLGISWVVIVSLGLHTIPFFPGHRMGWFSFDGDPVLSVESPLILWMYVLGIQVRFRPTVLISFGWRRKYFNWIFCIAATMGKFRKWLLTPVNKHTTSSLGNFKIHHRMKALHYFDAANMVSTFPSVVTILSTKLLHKQKFALKDDIQWLMESTCFHKDSRL